MSKVDLDAALQKVNEGYPRTKRDHLVWLIVDLVAELRAAREVIEPLQEIVNAYKTLPVDAWPAGLVAAALALGNYHLVTGESQ